MTELMSQEEIARFMDMTAPRTHPDILRLIETARAAHELKAEVERLTKELEGRSFAKLMDQEVDEELATARAEERERCAKIADRIDDPYIAEAIRDLKDA